MLLTFLKEHSMDRQRKLRSLHIAGVLLVLLVVGGGASVLYDTGIVGVTRKPNHVFAEPGCFCHGDSASPGVHAWMEGPDTLGAGASGVFTMHVAKDSSVAAGFNVAAFLGSLGILDSTGTQRMEPEPGDSAELTHVLPRHAEGSDTVSWVFLYHAPATGGVVDTLYANGNSVNLSDDPSGDAWAFAPEFLVHILSPSTVEEQPVAENFRLLQNYPNPFNPSTTIAYTLQSAGMVDMSVFDVTGREIATLVRGRREAGMHRVTFDAAAGAPAASGIYLCRLHVIPEGSAPGADVIQVRKMVVLR
jgi:hypothetical protein